MASSSIVVTTPSVERDVFVSCWISDFKCERTRWYDEDEEEEEEDDDDDEIFLSSPSMSSG
tara:strand:- start:247 stop:429 length:183 start_codon:yes stop_codon:yes gene_type:complete